MLRGEEQKDVREHLFEDKTQFSCLSSVILIGDINVGKNSKSQSLNPPLICSVRSGHAAEPGQV